MDTGELDRELETINLSGFWKTRLPNHRPEAPFIWKWKDAYRGLMKAKDTIGIELAERRTIRLVNPNAPVKSTSRTLQFTLSIVNPGELARAHRHNVNASRFVVQGAGAYTTVDGERFLMREGDLILTPNGTWHDHFNGSKEPIIWLDGLDGPLVESLNAVFFETYDRPAQSLTRQEGETARRLGFTRPPGGQDGGSSRVPFRYEWEQTYRSLQVIADNEADPSDGALLRFINPVTGGFTFPTMSWEVQLLRPGIETRPHRHMSTTLYHVFRGAGRTAVGEGYLEWEKGNSFVVPVWQPHRHENPFGEEAIVFSINDRPLMEAIGLYQEETA